MRSYFFANLSTSNLWTGCHRARKTNEDLKRLKLVDKKVDTAYVLHYRLCLSRLGISKGRVLKM